MYTSVVTPVITIISFCVSHWYASIIMSKLSIFAFERNKKRLSTCWISYILENNARAIRNKSNEKWPFISLLVLFPKGTIIQNISKDLHTKTWICLKIMLKNILKNYTLSFSQRKTLVFWGKSKTRNFICSPSSAIAKCLEEKTAWK